MSRLIEARFSLCDPLNAGFGYQVRIRDARTGESMLFTSRDPASGEDLLEAADCLRVIETFVKPERDS